LSGASANADSKFSNDWLAIGQVKVICKKLSRGEWSHQNSFSTLLSNPNFGFTTTFIR
jgi:hypothetical protein